MPERYDSATAQSPAIVAPVVTPGGSRSSFV